MAISRVDGYSSVSSVQIAPVVSQASTVEAPPAMETTVTNGQQQRGVDVQQTATSTEQTQSKDKQNVEFVSEAMNHFMQLMNADLQFSVHEKTHRVMVKLVDVSTKEVLKEIPSEDFLDMVAKIQEYIGMLIDKKA